MKYFINLFFILTILVIPNGVNGQFNYKNGIIITNKNDTLTGLIHDGGIKRNFNFCLFKAEKNKEIIKYYPQDIKAYRLFDDKFYKTKKIFFNTDSNLVFTDVLLEGKISLYYYGKNKDYQYFLENADGRLIGLENKNVTDNSSNMIIRYVQNPSVYIENYKDTLLSVFKDSKRVLTQIETVNYNQKSLINITKAYLHETCNEAYCITYEKDLSLSKPHLGAYSGIQLSKVEWKSMIKPDLSISIPMAVFLNFPMLFINDRFSFQIELISRSLNYRQNYSDLSGEENQVEIRKRTFGIPLLFKYLISSSRLNPSIGFGKETSFAFKPYASFSNIVLTHYKKQYGGWFLEAGLNYKIDEKRTLFTNFRFQSNSDLVFGKFGNGNYLPYYKVSGQNFYNIYKTGFAMLQTGVRF